MLAKFKACKNTKILAPNQLRQIKGGDGGGRLLTEEMEMVVEEMDLA
ncbi:MAG: hypothetical protein AAFP19_01735 [Bacteroidota bacterium]